MLFSLIVRSTNRVIHLKLASNKTRAVYRHFDYPYSEDISFLFLALFFFLLLSVLATETAVIELLLLGVRLQSRGQLLIPLNFYLNHIQNNCYTFNRIFCSWLFPHLQCFAISTRQGRQLALSNAWKRHSLSRRDRILETSKMSDKRKINSETLRTTRDKPRV